jgi:hypothetical protein
MGACEDVKQHACMAASDVKRDLDGTAVNPEA